MIDYTHFHFAGAPRTGTTWFIHAMYAAGLGEGNKAKAHIPFELKDPVCLQVSTVRHPCDWLMSYFLNVHRATLAIPCVDKFNVLPVSNFHDFIRSYLRRIPGEVGRMFSGYNSHSILRMEDYPWCAIELLQAVGVQQKLREQCLSVPIKNASIKRKPVWNKALYDKVLKAESRMIAEFDYQEKSCLYV